jgi:flagellar biosynthetic protein FliP
MNSQPIALPNPGGLEASPHAAHHAGGRGWVAFLVHFGQMFVAMMLGMGLFAVSPVRSRDVPELYPLLMAVSMTVPMVVWMHFRGHPRRASAEMAAAMVVPTLVLTPLVWLDIMSGKTLFGLEHVLMLPAMLAAMLYRRSEYGL